MKSKIDSYLLELTDRLAFLNLEEASLEGLVDTPEDFVIPVFVTDIRAFADGQDGFSTKQIAGAMLYIIGIDKDFRFNQIYIEFLKKVIDKPEAFAVELGMDKYNLKSYKDALVYLRAAMILNEKETYPVFNYGQIAYEFASSMSDKKLSRLLFEEAMSAYEKILELNPDEPYANFQLGLLSLEAGLIDRSIELLNKIVNLAESDLVEKAKTLLSEASAGKGLDEAESLIGEGEFDRALEVLKEINLKELPLDLRYSLLYAKGFTQNALGETEEALDSYTEAVRINNQDPILLADMGMCYALLGDFEQSLELYLSALDLEKDSIELLNNISIVYLNMNQIDKAKEYILRARDLDPSEEVVDETIRLIRSVEETQGSIV